MPSGGTSFSVRRQNPLLARGIRPRARHPWERGVDLFVEKPVCLDLEEGIRSRDAIERAGVLSSVGYGARYSAAAEATRRFCRGRTTGMVACDRWGGVPGDASHWWRRMEVSG